MGQDMLGQPLKASVEKMLAGLKGQTEPGSSEVKWARELIRLKGGGGYFLGDMF